MSTTETTVPAALAPLVRRFKRGYTLERTGGGHYRVRNPQGRLVQYQGKNLTLTGTGRSDALTRMETALTRAKVLSVAKPPKRKAVDVDKQQLAEQRRRATETRQQARSASALELHNRLTAVLEHVGGFSMRGMQSDLAYVASLLSRENGSEPLTPDLLTPSINRVAHGHWITPRYAAIWEKLADRLEQSDDVVDEWFALVRRARGLPEDVVAPLAPVAGSDWPFRVELLPIEAFIVDHDYQRPVPWAFVRKMSASFDESLVGTIDASERRRGAVLAILDGQCRYEAMRLVGKRTVWTSIYSGLDKEAEARFFLHKNQDRKAIHPFYTYRAKLAASDTTTLAYTKIVEQFGYRVAIVSATHDERNISAIAALEQTYKRQRPDSSRDCLTPTLALLKASTFGRASGQHTTLIRGVGRFYEMYRDDEIDAERLISVLSSRGAEWVLGRVREMPGATSTHETNVVRVLVDDYNRGIRAQRDRLHVPIWKGGHRVA